MTKCVLCSSDQHTWQKCPMFGSTKEYLKHSIPDPFLRRQEESPIRSSSFARNNFEELFSQDENALAEAMEDDLLSADERLLATELLVGTKKFPTITQAEKEMLERMTLRHYEPKTPRVSQIVRRPDYVRTREEMEGLSESPRRLEEHQEGPDFYSSINYSDDPPIR